MKTGGGAGIRTPGTRKSSTVFKTAALNHSATPPQPGHIEELDLVLQLGTKSKNKKAIQ
jgi:hypothetical protein